MSLTGTSFQYHLEGDYPTGRGRAKKTNRNSSKKVKGERLNIKQVDRNSIE